MRFAVTLCGEGAAPRPLIPMAAPSLSPGACVRVPKTNPGAFGHRGLFGGA